MQEESERVLFADMPVGKALLSMILPTVVSQIIIVIYNLADTWYVGLTENANAVAAVSLCLPLSTLMSALSNLFGVGGAGVLARALGVQDQNKAQRTIRWSILGTLVSAVFYSLIMLTFGEPILRLIGGDDQTMDYAFQYLFWVIVIGGIPTILGPVYGHLLRAIGHPKAASFGMILGAVLNIALDPLIMFVLLPPGNEVAGAAIATACSNGVSLLYFLAYFHYHHKKEVEIGKTFSKKNFSLLFEILQGGIPGFCMVALAMLSNCILNSMISAMGSEAVAGLGIVRKIDQLAYAVNQGITQGMLPLVAYCYSSGHRKRMWKAVGISAAASEIFSLICTTVSLGFAPYLVRIFIRDSATVEIGARFLRVLCLAIPIYTLTFVIIAVFQAAGKGVEPFLLSVLHKGSLDIAFLFLIRRISSSQNLVWAAPVSEAIALFVGIYLLSRFWNMMKQDKNREKAAHAV